MCNFGMNEVSPIALSRFDHWTMSLLRSMTLHTVASHRRHRPRSLPCSLPTRRWQQDWTCFLTKKICFILLFGNIDLAFMIYAPLDFQLFKVKESLLSKNNVQNMLYKVIDLVTIVCLISNKEIGAMITFQKMSK